MSDLNRDFGSERSKDEISPELRAKALKAGNILQSAKEEVLGEAKSRLEGAANATTAKAATQVHGVAESLHRAADDLEGQNATLGHYAHLAADKLASFGQSLENQDIGQLIGQAEDMARRQPALFFGVAAAAGFLLGRVIKNASQPRHKFSDHGNYASHNGFDTPNQSSGAYTNQLHTASSLAPRGTSFTGGGNSGVGGVSYSRDNDTDHNYVSDGVLGSGKDLPSASFTPVKGSLASDIEEANGSKIGTNGIIHAKGPKSDSDISGDPSIAPLSPSGKAGNTDGSTKES